MQANQLFHRVIDLFLRVARPWWYMWSTQIANGEMVNLYNCHASKIYRAAQNCSNPSTG